MSKKIIVLGKGFLGTRISESHGFKLSDFRVPVSGNIEQLEIKWNNKKLDDLVREGKLNDPIKKILADAELTDKFLEQEKPDIIINAAGKTGIGNIDWCEENPEETIRGNLFLIEHLARACARKNIYLANLGSGCIYKGYNGGEGFREDDRPNFGLNNEQFYAFAKILAEESIARTCKEYPDFRLLHLRLRMPIDDRPHPRNLITKLLGYKNLINVANSMTVVPNMLPALKHLIEQEKTGIYHLVNPRTISAAQIMELYKIIVDPKHKFEIIPLTELKNYTIAVRSNCYLNTDKLKGEGIELPEIHAAVKECLEKYKTI